MNKMIPRALLSGLLLAVTCGISSLVKAQNAVPPAPPAQANAAAITPAADDPGWPRTYTAASGQVVMVYQPQLDSWEGDDLKAHSAVSIATSSTAQPVFGMASYQVHTEVDKDDRMVHFDKVNVSDVRFPSAPDHEADFTKLIKASLPEINDIALDRLETSLSITEAQAKSLAKPVKNDPPTILFSTTPAILVYIDGDPAYRTVEGTALTRVINTRVLLLKDNKGFFYLHLFDGYLTAPSLSGPWSILSAPTPDIAKAEKIARDSKQVDLMDGVASAPPADSSTSQSTTPAAPPPKPTLQTGKTPGIVIAQKPTELIIFDGEPNYVAIAGTNLLYAANTTGNVFKSINDQRTYVLLSGRWFAAAGYEGPWTYVPGKKLPADFASIPDSSPKENVKASIPGTAQAQEAVIANSIPQTARVDLATTKMTDPGFDGAPKIEPIDGTTLKYVINSATPIIEVSGTSYYACQNGIWFASPQLNGPWVVATTVPSVIYTIPPSSPMFYLTYVRIYQVEPTYVVVGYTPGYTGTVVTTENIVVYGTGYVYTPWIGAFWYGPPITWGIGCAITWTPWGGWAFSFGFGFPVAPWGPWYPPAPWWGPYHGWAYGPHGGVAAWGPGGWAATSGNIYRQWGSVGSVSRVTTGFNAFTGNEWAGQYGRAYNSRTGTMAAGQRGTVGNVYTGNWAQGNSWAAGNARQGWTAQGGAVHGEVNGNDFQAAGVHTNTRNGSSTAGEINGHTFAAHDGHVYTHTDNGWTNTNALGANGGGTHMETPPMDGNRSLDSERASRNLGEQRYNSFQANRPSGGFRSGSSFGSRRSGGGFRR